MVERLVVFSLFLGRDSKAVEHHRKQLLVSEPFDRRGGQPSPKRGLIVLGRGGADPDQTAPGASSDDVVPAGLGEQNGFGQVLLRPPEVHVLSLRKTELVQRFRLQRPIVKRFRASNRSGRQRYCVRIFAG